MKKGIIQPYDASQLQAPEAQEGATRRLIIGAPLHGLLACVWVPRVPQQLITLPFPHLDQQARAAAPSS